MKRDRTAVNASEQRRREAGGVLVRSTGRWLHKDYAEGARERINAAAAEIIDEIIAEHPDAKVSARDAGE